jgi:hypothetical protein
MSESEKQKPSEPAPKINKSRGDVNESADIVRGKRPSAGERIWKVSDTIKPPPPNKSDK